MIWTHHFLSAIILQEVSLLLNGQFKNMLFKGFCNICNSFLLQLEDNTAQKHDGMFERKKTKNKKQKKTKDKTYFCHSNG